MKEPKEKKVRILKEILVAGCNEPGAKRQRVELGLVMTKGFFILSHPLFLRSPSGQENICTCGGSSRVAMCSLDGHKVRMNKP